MVYRIFKSRNITFVIGPEKEQFTAHESSIAGLSEPLRVLFTGNMKEAIEAKVIWEDVDPAVFVSLLEFAYTGSLSTSNSKQQGNRDGLKSPGLNKESCADKRDDKREDKGDDESDDDQRDNDERDDYESDDESEDEINDESDDKSDNESGDESGDVSDDDEQHSQNGDPGNLGTDQSDAENVTLMSEMNEYSARGKFSQKHFRLKQFHQLKDDPSSLNDDIIPYNAEAYIMTAKLYILADKYDIAALRGLCLCRFTCSLAHIGGREMTMDILAATIRYVYEHTIKKDQLRKLLLRFLITDLQWALGCNGIRKMLGDIPELASQLVLLVPSYYWEELQ
ncbi:hypothetical protein CCHR01_00898 [Colletotrichum chrysophilum]|uniref:BTB domain-containing protein n=1 Tax=Colletotrichum chrysophilum TaxID=1836956 RepID=A0AAD9B326_9PEZI|nr:hypothetical protein KNSL1_006100 [Colletotrichum chrysophilum]KAK1856519.1 hypothetical protein CCHR01_00898 [Colletotrichum chrysophilum]